MEREVGIEELAEVNAIFHGPHGGDPRGRGDVDTRPVRLWYEGGQLRDVELINSETAGRPVVKSVVPGTAAYRECVVRPGLEIWALCTEDGKEINVASTDAVQDAIPSGIGTIEATLVRPAPKVPARGHAKKPAPLVNPPMSAEMVKELIRICEIPTARLSATTALTKLAETGQWTNRDLPDRPRINAFISEYKGSMKKGRLTKMLADARALIEKEDGEFSVPTSKVAPKQKVANGKQKAGPGVAPKKKKARGKQQAEPKHTPHNQSGSESDRWSGGEGDSEGDSEGKSWSSDDDDGDDDELIQAAPSGYEYARKPPPLNQSLVGQVLFFRQLGELGGAVDSLALAPCWLRCEVLTFEGRGKYTVRFQHGDQEVKLMTSTHGKRQQWLSLVPDTVCEVCREATTSDENEMLLCGDGDGIGCDKGYHVQCLSPAVAYPLPEVWCCSGCCGLAQV
jgi:hypothetical protein